MKITLEAYPPPIADSGMLSAIQIGVVPAARLIQGFSMNSIPLEIVEVTNFFLPSKAEVKNSYISFPDFSRRSENSSAIIYSDVSGDLNSASDNAACEHACGPATKSGRPSNNSSEYP